MSASNNKIKRHPAWMDKLFPVVFTIAGLALLIIGSQTLFDGFSSKSWETTEGVIVESRLLDKGSGSGKKSNRRNYEPLVVYSYTIDGEYLTSDRILFDSLLRTPRNIYLTVNRYWVSRTANN